MTSLKKVLLDLAGNCRAKGREYYDKGDKRTTAIFWELETMFRKVAKEIEQ